MNLKNFDKNMFRSDLVCEFEISKENSENIVNFFVENSINDAIILTRKYILENNLDLFIKKVAYKGERMLVFYNSSIYKITPSNIEGMFYVKYHNSNEKLDIENYSSQKNWDTNQRVQSYCTLL